MILDRLAGNAFHITHKRLETFLGTRCEAFPKLYENWKQQTRFIAAGPPDGSESSGAGRLCRKELCRRLANF